MTLAPSRQVHDRTQIAELDDHTTLNPQVTMSPDDIRDESLQILQARSALDLF